MAKKTPILFDDQKVLTLRDLEIGDIFCNINDRKKEYVVRGNPVFNRGAGTTTRTCVWISYRIPENKSCRIKVIKLGESQFKEEYKLKPLNKI